MSRDRLASDERRQSIIEAARAVMWSKGVASFTVRDVAAAANVSLGTVTHHFGSSSEIVEGVLRAESDRLRVRVAEAMSRRSSALHGIDRLIRVALTEDVSARQFWTMWLEAGARVTEDEVLAKFFAERSQTWREVVRRLIDEGIAGGEFRDVDAASATATLVALIDGYGLHTFFDPSLSIRSARSAVRQVVRDLLSTG